MKLDIAQWIWMLAAVGFITIVLLVVVKVIQIPAVFLLAAGLLIMFFGRYLRPSMDKFKKTNCDG